MFKIHLHSLQISEADISKQINPKLSWWIDTFWGMWKNMLFCNLGEMTLKCKLKSMFSTFRSAGMYSCNLLIPSSGDLVELWEWCLPSCIHRLWVWGAEWSLVGGGSSQNTLEHQAGWPQYALPAAAAPLQQKQQVGEQLQWAWFNST